MAATIKKPDMTNQYTNLTGISDATKKNLNYYGQGYQPSQQVQDAQKYLQGIIDKQPGAYQSQYQSQIDDLYKQIMDRPEYQSQYQAQMDDLYQRILGRPAFSYDVANDPMYQQYKNQYVQQGQQAMQDTVGNAAALTGGYGNSWATTAGSQAYQGYLQQLNSMIPELEQRAYERYGQEGQEMRQNLGMLQGLDETAYGRYNEGTQNMRQNMSMLQGLENTAYGQYRDTVSDWQADRSYAAQRYDAQYEQEYNNWMAMLNMYAQLAQAENQNYWTEQANAKKGGGGGGRRGKTVTGQAVQNHGGDRVEGNPVTEPMIELAKDQARAIANTPEGQAIIAELNKYDPVAQMQANQAAMNATKERLTGSQTLNLVRAEKEALKNGDFAGEVNINGKNTLVTNVMANYLQNKAKATKKTNTAKTTTTKKTTSSTQALGEMLKR